MVCSLISCSSKPSFNRCVYSVNRVLQSVSLVQIRDLVLIVSPSNRVLDCAAALC
nr:MAG TPA: hypothetical protein [Bacteriophage sp.]